MQSNKPTVSVIMNCLNGEKYLREAIDSVIEQTYTNWELIFWDNASTDSSSAILKSYDDKRIKYYRAEETVPLGLARNYAIEKASGEFLCILDADDKFLPQKLDIQLNFMLNNPKVVLAYSNLRFIVYKNGKQSIKENKKETYEGNVFPQLMTEPNFIYLSTIIINTNLSGDELYFNPEYQITEEYELFLRLSLIGEFGYLNDVLGLYRIHYDSTLRRPDNHIIYLSERFEILEKFSNEIKIYNIHDKKIREKLYISSVLRFLRDGEREKAKKLVANLLKFPSIKNVIFYLFVKTDLSFIYKYYYSVKHNNPF